MGPRQSGYSALDVDDLTAVEVRSHRAMAAHLDFYRAHAPGFENAYLMLSAPQIGVRHARRLKGVDSVLRSRWPDGTALPDEIGVTPAVSARSSRTSRSPTARWCRETLDGLLACGRHISCDKNSHGFMREIPQCWITGQAAGAAAALAVAQGVQPRAVDVAALQAALLRAGRVSCAGGSPQQLARARTSGRRSRQPPMSRHTARSRERAPRKPRASKKRRAAGRAARAPSARWTAASRCCAASTTTDACSARPSWRA